MSDFTPGPWTVEIEDHAAPSNSFAAHVYAGDPARAGYRSVARVSQPDPIWHAERRAEAEADARLIAAAPSLLAALEAALEQTEDGLHAAPCDEPDCWVEAAHAAIRSANGEPA